MTRPILMFLFIVAALGVVACGDDSSIPQSEQETAQKASGLTQQLGKIERSVREDLSRLDGSSDEREQARHALADAERRARAVARAARSRLPKDDPARKQLEQAAQRLADAAATPAGQDDKAQQALDDARDHLGEAVGAIDDRLPDTAQERLKQVRDSLEAGG